MKRPSASNGAASGDAAAAILLIDLRVADLLLRGGAGRQQLLVDAGGHLRHVLVGVLRDARLHLGAELRQGLEQPAGTFRR